MRGRPGGILGAVVSPNDSGAFSGLWRASEIYAARVGSSWPLSAFAPTKITGLTAWFDASDAGSLFDSDTGGTAASPDGQVGRLENKIGNGLNFFQSNSAARPTRKANTKNGLDVIRFDGENDYMENVGLWSGMISASSSTVFIVASAASVTTDEEFIFDNQMLLGDTGMWNGWFVLKSDDTASAFANDEVEDQTATVSYIPPNWVVYEVRHDGTNLTARINGGSPASVNLGARASLGLSNTPLLGLTTELGNLDYTSKFFHGDLAELLIYNVALSESNQAAIEGYLADKWDIPISS
jgi:hypothetical protein